MTFGRGWYYATSMRFVSIFIFVLCFANALSAQTDSTVKSNGDDRVVTYTQNGHRVLRRTYWHKQLQKEEQFRNDTVYAHWETYFFPFGHDTTRWENGKQLYYILIRNDGDTGWYWKNLKKEGCWRTPLNSYMTAIARYHNDSLLFSAVLIKKDFTVAHPDIGKKEFHRGDTINRFVHAKCGTQICLVPAKKQIIWNIVKEDAIEVKYFYPEDMDGDSLVSFYEICFDTSGHLLHRGFYINTNKSVDSLYYPLGKLKMIRPADEHYRSFYENGSIKEEWSAEGVACYNQKGKKVRVVRIMDSVLTMYHVNRHGELIISHDDRQMMRRYRAYYDAPYYPQWTDELTVYPRQYEVPKSY